MRELLTELGKLIYDIAKITFALAILSPVIKSGSFSLYAIMGVVILISVGSYIIYRGAQK